jgi:hypothetical protein
MKKFYYIFILVVVFGCSKKVDHLDIENLNITSYASNLATDSLFADMLGDLMLSRQAILDYNNHITNDSSEINRTSNRFGITLANFVVSHQEFLYMTAVNREKTLIKIGNLMRDKQFVDNNSEKLSYILSKNNEVSRYASSIRNGKGYVKTNSENVLETNKFTNTEILECALNVLTNVVGSYSNLLDDMRVLTKGLTGVNLLKTATDFILSNSPWYKTASVVISIGLCVYTSID